MENALEPTGAAMTDTDTAFAPNPLVLAQVTELKELGAQHPVPALAEVMADWKWLHDAQAAGTFDPDYRYGGLAVAVYDRRVVGTGIDWLQLRIDMARKYGAHPERFVITSFPEA